MGVTVVASDVAEDVLHFKFRALNQKIMVTVLAS
jgi:hypothetical protein